MSDPLVVKVEAAFNVCERCKERKEVCCGFDESARDLRDPFHPDKDFPGPSYCRDCCPYHAKLAEVVKGEAEKDANGNTFVFCDYVEDVKRNGVVWGCVRGAGHNGPHALCLPPYPQAPVLLKGEAEKDAH